jgi:hypothetical protein
LRRARDRRWLSLIRARFIVRCEGHLSALLSRVLKRYSHEGLPPYLRMRLRLVAHVACGEPVRGFSHVQCCQIVCSSEAEDRSSGGNE